MEKQNKKNDNVVNIEGPADFEKAISETGFGKFNYILLLIALPSCLASIFETSTMSYVLPIAECDLSLTLMDKGVLNAITYAGMMTSAIIWGYLADTRGRRKLLVYGYLLDGLCVMFEALSQNVYMLMTFKYLGGFLMCGPFAVLMSYITEFHGNKYRARIMMIIGMFFSVGSLILTLMAWAVLPVDLELRFFNNFIVVHSWQIFLACCAIPSLISGTAMLFMPESPKFLMSCGRNDEALRVFQKIYTVNMGKPENTYPVTQLIEETEQQFKPKMSLDNTQPKEEVTQSALKSLSAGLKQLKPMLSKPHLGNSIHVYTIQFCTLLGLNTMRLWLPQLFSSFAEYEQSQFQANSTDSINLCSILSYSVNKSNIHTTPNLALYCEVNISEDMYINTLVVSVCGLVAYCLAGSIINALGNRGILVLGLAIAGLCGIGMYWANSSHVTLMITSTFVNVGSISSTAILGIVVALFPTQLRTMIVSISMMFGRFGALLGNVLFPYFISMGCLPPFLMVGSIMLISSILSCFLPNTDKKALK